MWSDAELVRRCRRNEPAAWRELVKLSTPVVFRLASRMLNDPSEASDVTQEVLLRVHRSLDSYDPTRPLSPWIHHIAYHACLRRLERVKRTEPLMEDGDHIALDRTAGSPASNPESELCRKEAHAYLLDAMANLSAQDRGLLVLRYREGLSDAELAEVTGIAVNTVKTRIFRARKTLKEMLSGVLRETDT